MMRRGELAQYPPAEVLRAAAAERLTGGIEFDGDTAVCVYLEEGEVYLAARTDAEVTLTVADELDDAAYEAARLSDEGRLRAATVEVVADLVGRRDGWYFFHGLTDHPAQGHWSWPVEEVLRDAAPPETSSAPTGGVDGRAPALSSSETDPMFIEGRPPRAEQRAGSDRPQPGQHRPGSGPAADGPADVGPGRWRIGATPPTEGLDPGSWAVLVAMAGAVTQDDLVARLGWSPDQASIAIGSLASRGILVPASVEAPDGTGVVPDREPRPAG